MSFDLSVLFKAEKMVTAARWASAIREHGFEMTMVTDIDLRTLGGWLPCTWNGEDAGFEYYFTLASEDNFLAEMIEECGYVDFDASIMMSCRGEESVASGIAAAAVWAVLTGGVVSNPQQGTDVEAEKAIAWARQVIERKEF